MFPPWVHHSEYTHRHTRPRHRTLCHNTHDIREAAPALQMTSCLKYISNTLVTLSFILKNSKVIFNNSIYTLNHCQYKARIRDHPRPGEYGVCHPQHHNLIQGDWGWSRNTYDTLFLISSCHNHCAQFHTL